jgi:hypothetical protein
MGQFPWGWGNRQYVARKSEISTNAELMQVRGQDLHNASNKLLSRRQDTLSRSLGHKGGVHAPCKQNQDSTQAAPTSVSQPMYRCETTSSTNRGNTLQSLPTLPRRSLGHAQKSPPNRFGNSPV